MRWDFEDSSLFSLSSFSFSSYSVLVGCACGLCLWGVVCWLRWMDEVSYPSIQLAESRMDGYGWIK